VALLDDAGHEGGVDVVAADNGVETVATDDLVVL
jgi:hypothetical protein